MIFVVKRLVILGVPKHLNRRKFISVNVAEAVYTQGTVTMTFRMVHGAKNVRGSNTEQQRNGKVKTSFKIAENYREYS